MKEKTLYILKTFEGGNIKRQSQKPNFNLDKH